MLLRNFKVGQGWGAVVAALALFSLKATRELTDLLERPGFYDEHHAIAIVVGAIAAILVAVLGFVLNRDRVDHKLLWVPIQYWAVVIVILTLADVV